MELQHKNSITIGAEQQQRKEKFVGSFKLHNGQNVFELDLKTGLIKLASYESSTVSFPTKDSIGIIRTKLLANENCIYVPAINLTNAKKKFDKILDRRNARSISKSIPVSCIRCDEQVMSYLVSEFGKVKGVKFDTCRCGYLPKIEDYIK